MKVSIYNERNESVIITDFGFDHDSEYKIIEIIVL